MLYITKYKAILGDEDEIPVNEPDVQTRTALDPDKPVRPDHVWLAMSAAHQERLRKTFEGQVALEAAQREVIRLKENEPFAIHRSLHMSVSGKKYWVFTKVPKTISKEEKVIFGYK